MTVVRIKEINHLRKFSILLVEKPNGYRTRFFVTILLCVVLDIVSVAQTSQWPRENPPPPLFAPKVEFPDYELRQLNNGLQVVIIESREQPVVNVRLLIRAGTSSDPTDKPGVAALAAQLLDQGTTGRTAQEIAASIDNVGGFLSVGAGADFSFINILVMNDRFNFALELLSDVTRYPAYLSSELDRQRQQMLSGMQVNHEDPEYVANMIFERLIYGSHPYGNPYAGTPESVRRITRMDLQTFHKSHYLPNNAILAIVGDVSSEETFNGIVRALGDWERGDFQVSDPVDPPISRQRLILVDKPGAVQTVVRVGHLALPRSHEDFLALDLAIKIFGGEGGNRLGSLLRTDKSLTYSASAELAGHQFSGSFMAKTETRSSATIEVLRLTVDEISRLKRERVQRAELIDAQAYLAGHFPLTIETPDAIATLVLEALLYGLDLDAIEKYAESINAMTINDIQRAASNYLNPDSLSIVLVGDCSTFADSLAGIGFDDYEIFSMSELDLSDLN